MNARGLLIDLDGTLYTESGPVPGARETLTRLETAGIPYRYVTNTTRKPRREIVRRLSELNFPAREHLTFAPAAANTLLQGRRVHALIAEPILEDLDGVILVNEVPEYVLPGRRFGERLRLHPAQRGLPAPHGWRGARRVAEEPFLAGGGGLSLEAGPLVAALEYASGKTATAVVGKPEPAFFEAALRDLWLEAKDVAMVDDDPESDVAGAQAAGLVGIQLRMGKYRPGNGGEPDVEIESVARSRGYRGLYRRER